MRIEESSPDRLVVTSRPWIFMVGGHLVAFMPVFYSVVGNGADGPWMRLLLFLIGAVFSFVVWRYLPFLTLVLDRTSGDARILHHRVTGTTVTRHSLAQITGAMYQSDWSDGTRLERLALRGPEGPIPVEFGYSSGTRAPIAEKVDAWIKRRDL